VEKVVSKFKTLEEADLANRRYYQSLTPEERIDILIKMIDDYHGTEHRLERVPGSARILSREDFIRNKLAIGRPKDLADVEAVRDIE